MPRKMLAYDTLIAARDALRGKKISATELVRQAIDRIDNLDPQFRVQQRLA